MKLTLEKSAEKYFKNNRDALKDYVGFSKDGAAFTVNFLPDGSKSRISVSKDENGINISCPEKYFMRALGIAVKNRNKKSYSVTEKPRFEDLTFLIDCSRNGVINFATFKNLVVNLALIGYNAALAPIRLAALSKLNRVRVDGSKNKVATTFPLAMS